MARTARAHCCLGLTQWHCTAGTGPSTQSNHVRHPIGMGAIMGRANQGVRRSGGNAGGRDMSIQNIGIGQKNKQKQGTGEREWKRSTIFNCEKCHSNFIILMLEENGGQDKRANECVY